MSWKPKYYIVFSDKSMDDLKWECTTHYQCYAHIPNMLQELLGVSTIGGELKICFGWWHKSEMVKKHNVTYDEIDDFFAANTHILSFSAEGTRKKAVKQLLRLGAKGLCLVDSYRDAILYQAYYHKNKSFPNEALVV